MATRQMGMLTKKIHRQDRPLVSTPPSTGPMAVAMPVVAPKMPKAVPRSRPRKALASRARPVANTAAPPMPWKARARVSCSTVWAAPHAVDPTVKTTSPMTKTRRRPKRSASDPAVSSRAARLRA